MEKPVPDRARGLGHAMPVNVGFNNCETLLERGLKRPLDNRYASQLKEADPLFSVWGSKP